MQLRNLGSSIICVCAFILAWCLCAEVMATNNKRHWGKEKIKRSSDAEFEIEVYLDKDVDPGGEEQYTIAFEMGSEDESGVTRIQIKSPKGKKINLKYGLPLGEIDFGSTEFSLKDFQNVYPEGKYTVTLFPKSKYGSRTFDISYDFPSTPEITYPENGAVDLPLSFTIEWESLGDDIDGLIMAIENEEDEGAENLEFERFLSTDTTSFVVPDGLLKSDTQYNMELIAYRSSGDGIVFSTFQSILVTTGSE